MDSLKTEIKIDVEEVLNELGVRNVKMVGAECNYSCPGPEHKWGDHRPSGYLRNSYPYPYICFGCGRQGTVIDFVADYLGIDRAKAWRWLGEKFGFGDSYDPEGTITETINRILGPKSRVEKRTELNPEINPHGFIPLEDVKPGWDYMISRGIQDYTLKQFKFQWDPRSGRVAIPIRDAVNRLIGFKARDITGQKEPKYLVLGDRKDYKDYGFKPYNSSLTLFGIHMHRANGLPIVVVEGELNSLRVYEAGYHAVGLPTAAMSAYQAALLREKYEDAILFLDSDQAGQKGLNTALNLLSGACKIKVVEDHENDPMEMTNEQIKELINTAKSPLQRLLR